MTRDKMETFLILCGWHKLGNLWINDSVSFSMIVHGVILESAYCIQMRGVDIWKRTKKDAAGCDIPGYRHAMKEAAEHVTT